MIRNREDKGLTFDREFVISRSDHNWICGSYNEVYDPQRAWRVTGDPRIRHRVSRFPGSPRTRVVKIGARPVRRISRQATLCRTKLILVRHKTLC